MVWQRRRDSEFGSGERRWCGPSSDAYGCDPDESRPRPQSPSSNPSSPALTPASPQQLRPIPLRLLRARTIYVTLLTGRRDLPAASLVHDQDVSRRMQIHAEYRCYDAKISIVVVEAPIIGGETAYRGHDDRHASPPHRASHSPFPSSSPSFVPPPMPAKHDSSRDSRNACDAYTLLRPPARACSLACPTTWNPHPAPTPNASLPTPTNINISISTTPSASTSTKHTSLSSSRPAHASPSAPPSRRQSLSSKRHSQLS
ncbi:hypothetical protein M422DRAFT_268143 [Sphaerobolus stellatus SS14]|uniref:Uncharacterized protein n=1 Tax=Sphaerobolus stellatus (strain SS14) TaxID=990650 RepID=A0A0C9TKS7_SPHS4|nr:hypothetical protein M422DRAFT_268143 [Sphaerobolus stellatus SS14]